MGKPKLDKRASRTDLTSRECAQLLGGVVGSLCELAEAADIKAALSWWAQNPGLVDVTWQASRDAVTAMMSSSDN